MMYGLNRTDAFGSSVYNLGIGTYALATFHFTTELLVFKSVKPNRASIGPLIVGCWSNFFD